MTPQPPRCPLGQWEGPGGQSGALVPTTALIVATVSIVTPSSPCAWGSASPADQPLTGDLGPGPREQPFSSLRSVMSLRHAGQTAHCASDQITHYCCC